MKSFVRPREMPRDFRRLYHITFNRQLIYSLYSYSECYPSRSAEIRRFLITALVPLHGEFLYLSPRRCNIRATGLTLILSSGSQITKSASIPADRVPLRPSRPHNFAGWLLSNLEISGNVRALVFAAVHISGNPVYIFGKIKIRLSRYFHLVSSISRQVWFDKEKIE